MLPGDADDGERPGVLGDPDGEPDAETYPRTVGREFITTAEELRVRGRRQDLSDAAAARRPGEHEQHDDQQRDPNAESVCTRRAACPRREAYPDTGRESIREDLQIRLNSHPKQCSTDGHRQSDRAELFTGEGGAFCINPSYYPYSRRVGPCGRNPQARDRRNSSFWDR